MNITTPIRSAIAFVPKLMAATTNIVIAAVAVTVLVLATKYIPASILILGDAKGFAAKNEDDSIYSYIGSLLSKLSEIPFADTIITMVTWGLIGLACYTIFYLLANSVIDARNEIIVDMKTSRQGVVLPTLVRHAASKSLSVVAYVVFVILSFMYLFGIWFDMIDIFVLSGFSIANILFMVAGGILVFFNIYLIMALAFLIWRNNSSVV